MQDVRWHIPRHDLIRNRTSDRANQRIDRRTWESVQALESPSAIRARLNDLDREWNVDRALMLNFAIVGAISAAMALRAARQGRVSGWQALLFTQLGFLAYHAVRRWCPPLPVFRRLGFRSDQEIAAERVALEKRLVSGTGFAAVR